MFFRMKKRCWYKRIFYAISAVLALQYCTFPHVKIHSSVDNRSIYKIHNSNRTDYQPCSSIVKLLGTSKKSLYLKLCEVISKRNIVKDKTLIMDSLNKWHSMLALFVFSNITKSKQEVSDGLDYSGINGILC